MTVQEFFTELNKGATWSAGVAFKRAKALPLERWEIFASKTDLDSYAAGTHAVAGAVAYPGQICKVATSSGVTIYYLDHNLVPQLLVDEEGIVTESAHAALSKIHGSNSVNVTTSDSHDVTISLPGADSATQGQVYTVLGKDASGNNTFGFMDVSGGGSSSGTGLKFYDYDLTSEFTAEIPFSTHAINSENIVVHTMFLKSGSNEWWDAEQAGATVKSSINGEKTVNVSVSASPAQFSKVRILLVGGAVQSVDQVAQNGMIMAGTVEENGSALFLHKADGSKIDISLQNVTPSAENLADIITGSSNGTPITIETNEDGKLVIGADYSIGYIGSENGTINAVSDGDRAYYIDVNVSEASNNALLVKEDGLYVPIPPAPTVTGVKANDEFLKLEGTELTSTIDLEYVKADKKIYLKGLNGTAVSEINVDDFIKDGMLSEVKIQNREDGEKELVFNWNTDSGIASTTIALKDLAAVYQGGNGINIAWDSDKDTYVMSIGKGANTDSKYIVLSEGKIDLDFSSFIADKSLATTTDVANAKDEAVKHTNDELKKYTTTETLEANYATKTYAEGEADDAEEAAKGYTDEQLKSYIKYNDIGSVVPSIGGMNDAIQEQVGGAIETTKSYTDQQIGFTNNALSQEITDRENAINAINETISKLGDTYATDSELNEAVLSVQNKVDTESTKKQNKIVMHTDVTITEASWVQDGDHYKYVLGATGYAANCSVDIIPYPASYETILAAEIWPTVEFANQAITIYASKKPEGDIKVDIREIPIQ